jgi:hypothetical protein
MSYKHLEALEIQDKCNKVQYGVMCETGTKKSWTFQAEEEQMAMLAQCGK